jgi:hypothetical protein
MASTECDEGRGQRFRSRFMRICHMHASIRNGGMELCRDEYLLERMTG